MTEKMMNVGDLYHQGTKYRREQVMGGGPDDSRPLSPYDEDLHTGKRLRILPPATKGGKLLWEAIAQRRSVREFSQQPLAFSALSQLIWVTQGITLKARGWDFRAVPSAGALYPIETYVLVNRVERLSPGVYHYDVGEAEIVLMRAGDFGAEVAMAGLGQEMLKDAGAVFIWTAVVRRSKWKYRERAYRYIYMDAGHIGQNLYLAATALNLGCCTVGAFFDEEVDRLVGVDGKEEFSVYLGAVGNVA